MQNFFFCTKDAMFILFSEKETCILDSNTINMNRETYNQEQGQLEKYTCSNALMQSCKWFSRIV